MFILAPSLLSADFSDLTEEIRKIEEAGAEYLHLDIMDGHFVPNITFGAPVVKCIRPVTDMVFDVHLMIENPEKYIEDFAKAGADILNVHAETVGNLKEIIDKIHALGCKAGVTIKPDTPLSAIENVLDCVEMVLVMTVYPGFSGQKLIPQALAKIPVLNNIKKENGYNFDIQIDGGVGLNNLREVLDTGANIVVAGSAVFSSPDPAKASRQFLEIFKEYENV
ncbi:ribulose-phosphate 3-epimerase [Anaerotignum faecicola]|nr:ribulose-phosphate 3-epimerase [Anaerotignum faecicola]